MKCGYIYKGKGAPPVNEQRRDLLRAGVEPTAITADMHGKRDERDAMLNGVGWRRGETLVIARADVLGDSVRDRRSVVDLLGHYGVALELAGTVWPLDTADAREAYVSASMRAHRGSGGKKGGRPRKFTLTAADEAQALAWWRDVETLPTLAAVMVVLRQRFGPAVTPSDFYTRLGPRKPKSAR